ncbi:MAG: TIGR00282 family metallophosphoesterase [Alicyclobacillaceae bacterium]|nr:TIGR00282 family metallophosphoesterase [Alicyclobacillaceae bacterium]
MRVLFIGDIVGNPGRSYVREQLSGLIRERQPDLVIANAENAVDGRGLNQRAADELYDAGIEIITLGNHAWDQKDLSGWINGDHRIVRPANYPPGTPGRGYTLCRVNGCDVLIVNVMGRAFLSQLDCPFRAVDAILREHAAVRHVFVDMHAEATSEKVAMGWYLAGRVSAVLGTHTHVPTADERILPGGTAYVTDVGMVGPRDGVLGMNRDAVIRKMLTHLPVKFSVAQGPRQFCAVEVDTDDETGRAQSIRRVFMAEE